MKKLAILAFVSGAVLLASNESFAQCGPGFYGGGYRGYGGGFGVSFVQPGFGVNYGYRGPVYAAPVYRPHPRPVYRGGFYPAPYRVYRPVGRAYPTRGYGGVYFRF